MKKLKFWILVGPGSLLAATLLLFYKTAFLLGRPAWMFGFGISISLASGISYLICKEILIFEKNLQKQKAQKDLEAANLKDVLGETQHLYRRKVDQLEEAIVSIEKQQEELHQGYEELFGEANSTKNHLTSYQTSLDDALEELRTLRQMHYLEQERGKRTPKDLLSQHKQLREQFEEKSLILDQTRRRLFMIEGHLIALKKQQALEKLDSNSEEEVLVSTIKALDEENKHLEKEISKLEELVATSFKPTRAKKSKKQLENMLEFQFEKSTEQS